LWPNQNVNRCAASNIWNTTDATNNNTSGITIASIVPNILLDLLEDVLMSSLTDNSMTSTTAIRTPPKPPLRIIIELMTSFLSEF
jgi:hypothetical protein